MNATETPAEVADAIDQQVTEILEQAEITEPPVDSMLAATSRGMELAWDKNLVGRARIVRLRQHQHTATGGAILLRPEPRNERRQWAVAHEIGESVAHRIFSDLGLTPADAGEPAREQVANLFANRLLLPTAWFYDQAIAYGWDLLQLKSRFTTASHEVIARRMLDFAPKIIVTICDQGAVSFRRGNTGAAAPPLSELERACQRAVHDSGKPHSEACEEFVVQGWPVREDGWRREILRLAVLNDWH